MKKYSVFMNCIRMSNKYDTFGEAKEYLVQKIRKYEEEGCNITYGTNAFAVSGKYALIYEIIEEAE